MWILVLSTLALCARGQEEDLRRFPFRVISWVNRQPPEVMYLFRGKPVRVQGIQSGNRSAFYRYEGTGDLVFYQPQTPEEIETGVAPEVLAQVEIAESVRYPLILLLPDPNPETPPYRAVVFNDDPEVFPFRGYWMLNTSDVPVMVSLGNERALLRPGERRLVESDQDTMNLLLGVEMDSGRGWQLVHDDFLPNWEGQRTLLFLARSGDRDDVPVTPRLVVENRRSWDAGLERLEQENSRREE